MPHDELVALGRAFRTATWFTSRDVRERPRLAQAIAARTPGSEISIGKRLRELRVAGEKGGMRKVGRRARNAGLRWRVASETKQHRSGP